MGFPDLRVHMFIGMYSRPLFIPLPLLVQQSLHNNHRTLILIYRANLQFHQTWQQKQQVKDVELATKDPLSRDLSNLVRIFNR
jgi:hypothetical protein